jgi:glycerate kinase
VRVLVAFDKFKDSLSAREACETAAHALAAQHRDWSLDLCPLADGGEGFCEILTQAAGGHTVVTTVTGPRGEPVQAPIGFVSLAKIPPAARTLLRLDALPSPASLSDRIAIVEMAAASGLALLEPEARDPWRTTSFGTGELIETAAQMGAGAVLLGVGGSATHDLGLGALGALGLTFLDAQEAAIDPPVPAHWRAIQRLEGRVSVPPLRIACDVTNPLLGPRGAAAVYGPQKGLRPGDLARLDHESARLAMLLCAHCGQADALMETPGAGAAGGIAFGLLAAAGAQLVSGFELVSAWLDLEARLAAADLVITGEGRFDDSSLQGKGPGAVVARALALGKRVQVFAGRVELKAAPPAGLALRAITPPEAPLALALHAARGNLATAVRSAFATAGGAPP